MFPNPRPVGDCGKTSQTHVKEMKNKIKDELAIDTSVSQFGQKRLASDFRTFFSIASAPASDMVIFSKEKC